MKRRLQAATIVTALMALSEVLAAPGAHGADLWLTRTRDGLDAAGNSGLDRIEIRPDRRVTWRTASLGRLLPGGCSPGGGKLTGELAARDVEELGRLALAAADSQPKPSGDDNAPPVRELRQSLNVIFGSRSWAGPIARSTRELEKLDQALNRIRTRLSPTSVVSMSVRHSSRPDTLIARFVAPGTESIPILLPGRPSEVFSFAGRTLKYPHAQVDRLVLLGPARRVLEVELVAGKDEGAKGPDSGILSYSNAQVRHHAPEAPELFLCSEAR